MTWQEHRDEAEEQELLEDWEQAALHFVRAAAALMELGRPQDAPELIYLQSQAGKALRRSGHPEQALSPLQNALQLATLIESEDLRLLLSRQLGETALVCQRYPEALAHLEAAKTETLDPELYLLIARAQLAQGQESEGLKNLERTCKLHFKAKNLRGMVQSVVQAAETVETAQLLPLAKDLYEKALDLTELWPESERDTTLQTRLQERLDALHQL